MIISCREHHNGFKPYETINLDIELNLDKEYCYHFLNKKGDKQKECFRIHVKDEKGIQKHYLSNSYYIGVDWIIQSKKAIYVAPKVNSNNQQVDYLSMLFSALKHPSIQNYTADLFDIKFEEPQIEIEQKQDLLTPLLVVQFLTLMKEIVRKGIKKSYYKVEKNLYAKVKGKILVSQTIKQNHFKNKTLNTICSYEEYGVDNFENRLLKKALVFVQKYLPSIKIPQTSDFTTNLLNYITPAFESVSEQVSLNEVKRFKTNAFYKEYKEATAIAKLILKRFGYNINTIQNQDKIKTPPFWIDMSKLFELYVLGLLKDVYSNEILYDRQAKANYGLPDYLLNNADQKMVIDAKYKLQYNDFIDDEENNVKSSYAIENIRQIAAYARDRKVLNKLSLTDNDVVDCLIIYPLKNSSKQEKIELDAKEEIKQFSKFYKLGVSLPLINF